ncbi:MAG: ABC transporter substrate-binding protein [Deltaproteobacteria bacterium]|nr:ABC transporter substrate-binding protein [Deltaproteobacteria bacterium]
MKKNVLILWITGLLLFGLIGSLPAADPIKIGFVASITGGASWLGEPEKNTALMVQEWVNKAGGINGRPLEIIIEDSKSAPDVAVLATKKLIEKDQVVVIIGSSTSGESMAMANICEKPPTGPIPMISMAAASQIVTPAEEYKRIVESPRAAFEIPKVQRPWIFKTPQTDTLAVEAIYNYMKKKGITKVGLVTVSDGFGSAGRGELKRLAPKYGISLVADEVYGPKDSDMTAQLTRIKASGAQAVINWSIGPTLVIVTKNWKALSLGIPLYQSHGYGSKKNIELAGGAAEGVIAPLGRVVGWEKLSKNHPQYEVVSKYVPEYEKRFKSEVSTFGGHAYDAIYIVVNALKKVGTDKAKIRDYLETQIKNWPGTGGIFNMSPADHTGLDHTAFEMITVVKGDWEFAK